jgi:two-component system NtrC family response regulator
MILDALAQTQGVQARAAKVLGISERSLWYRIKKLGIQVRTSDEAPPAG